MGLCPRETGTAATRRKLGWLINFLANPNLFLSPPAMLLVAGAPAVDARQVGMEGKNFR